MCKNLTHDHTSGLTFKILLLVPKPTGHLVPRCRKNFRVCGWYPSWVWYLTLLAIMVRWMIIHGMMGNASMTVVIWS